MENSITNILAGMENAITTRFACNTVVIMELLHAILEPNRDDRHGAAIRLAQALEEAYNLIALLPAARDDRGQHLPIRFELSEEETDLPLEGLVTNDEMFELIGGTKVRVGTYTREKLLSVIDPRWESGYMETIIYVTFYPTTANEPSK